MNEHCLKSSNLSLLINFKSIVLDVEWKSWVLDEQAAEKSREEWEQIRTRDLLLEWEERKESLVRQTPRPPLMSPRQVRSAR